MTQDADWIREGGHAVEYRSNFNAPDQVTPVKIVKLTKTQIVLDNNNRFRRDDLRKVGEGHSYSGFTTLAPVNDPRIRDVVAERRLRALARRIETIPAAARGKGQAGVLAALDEIEEAVRAARKAITGKEV